MMKRKKVIIIFILLITIIIFPNVNLKAADNAKNDNRGYYTYDYWGNVMTSAPAYTFSRELTYSDLNLSDHSAFYSVYYFNDKIYIIDEGLNQIHIVDYNFNLITSISSFINDDTLDYFKSPEGITVDKDGKIYIADTGNYRLVVLNPDYSLDKIIGKPSHLALEGLTFVPVDVGVSYTGRIYVVEEKSTYGILELDNEGNFLKFTGTNPFSQSIMDIIWRALMNNEQKKYAYLNLPQQFISIDVDDDGFIYATAFTKNDPIKRINFNGNNVLVKNWIYDPIGDIDGSSEFISVSATDKGIYAALDRTNGRIFVYNCDGEMLYMFGGLENQNDYFKLPRDICWLKNDEIAIVDQTKSSVVIFEPTPFGSAVNEASRYHYDGLYEEALEYWELAHKYNANYDLAYIGIGKAHLFTKNYEEAMEYFKLGNNRNYYSKAYSKYSQEFIKNNFGYFVVGIALIFIGFKSKKIIRYIRKRKEQDTSVSVL